MRQRTKIGEYWRVDLMLDAWTPYGRRDSPIEARRLRDEIAKHHRNPTRIRKVSVVELAPLVVLPAWHAPTMCPTTMCTSDEPEIFAEYFQKMGIWVALVEFNGDEHITEHATADEARAACEKRLRELGYRVARATKAGAT